MTRQTHSCHSIGKALVILWAVWVFFFSDSLFALPWSDNCMRQSTESEQVYLPQASRQVLMSCARRDQGRLIGQGIVMGTQRRGRHVVHAFGCQSAWVNTCKYVILSHPSDLCIPVSSLQFCPSQSVVKFSSLSISFLSLLERHLESIWGWWQ